MLQLGHNSDKRLLTQQLRRYSVEHVKITKEETEWAKHVVDMYLKNEVLQYITSNSNLPISKQEYTGSLYEKLKTEAADEVDVMVVLQTAKQEVTKQDAGFPGFALLRAAKGSPFEKYSNPDGFILPEKLRASWFYGLVQKAVNELNAKWPDVPVELKVSAHGPAVQLDLTEKTSQKKLSADLVPSFQFGATEYFVAKPYKGKNSSTCDPKLMWRQSFSLREKARLQEMDKEDHGCRHELLRIAKTIVRGEPTFAKLTSYHLKTVFLHYNAIPQKWDPDFLGERFVDYFEMLYDGLAAKQIKHYWTPGVNLLSDIQDKTLENMADRLRRILDSDKERSKVLKCQVSGPPLMSAKETSSSSVVQCSNTFNSPYSKCTETLCDLLLLLRGFIVKLGKVLSEENKWAREVINKYLKDGVLKYCQERSMLLGKFEYGGSLYEGLKTKGPDKGDAVILAVLKTRKGDITHEVKKPSHALLRCMDGSPLREQFSNPEGFLIPEKIKAWFYKLVVAALQSLSACGDSNVSLKASNCPLGIKVKISKNRSNVLEVQLVPTFQLQSEQREYYTPLSQGGSLVEGIDPALTWEKSFTLQEKSLLKDMDQDKGCRHDLLRVVKSILQREPTFYLLTSHHLKTALLWYNKEAEDWSKDSLSDRFIGFLRFLQDALQKKVISHFWIKELNLLSGIPNTTLENMYSRLTKLLSSEKERIKVLRSEEMTQC